MITTLLLVWYALGWTTVAISCWWDRELDSLTLLGLLTLIGLGVPGFIIALVLVVPWPNFIYRLVWRRR